MQIDEKRLETIINHCSKTLLEQFIDLCTDGFGESNLPAEQFRTKDWYRKVFNARKTALFNMKGNEIYKKYE